MFITGFKVQPVYLFRPDWKYDEDAQKYTYLRNIQYTVTLLSTADDSLTYTAAQLLAHAYARIPDQVAMQKWTAPVLTGQSDTLYSRGSTREGSDYIDLPSSLYAWRVVRASTLQTDPVAGDYKTIYVVSGRWDKYQGMCYNIYRRA